MGLILIKEKSKIQTSNKSTIYQLVVTYTPPTRKTSHNQDRNAVSLKLRIQEEPLHKIQED